MVETGADTVAAVFEHEDMVPLLKRHEIQVLRKAGHLQSEIARLAGVSERTVRRIEAEEPVAHVDDEVERAKRGVGRPSKSDAYRDLVAKMLEAEPDLVTLELLRRAKLAGYAGRKTAFYALVAGMRPTKHPAPIVRFEGLAGEFSQHDFGHVDVRFVDGPRRRVHFFASRLKYSRFSQVTIVPEERVETLLRGLVDHLDAFGGLPLLAVFDRPKTIVLKAREDGSVRDWNPTFAQATLDLGIGVELCWPRSGNQKGSVERLVGWVKNSFFKPRRFTDTEDLHHQLDEWIVEVNTVLRSRATGVTPQSLIEEERSRFRTLKVRPADFALRIPVVVGPTAHVVYENVLYPMPPDSVHFPGTLYLYRDRVRIVAGRFTSEQARRRPGDPVITPAAYRAETLARVHGKRARRYYQREQLLQLGANAERYLTELVHRRERTWHHDVEALFVILQNDGEDRLRRALDEGLAQRTFGAEYVKTSLRKQYDEEASVEQRELFPETPAPPRVSSRGGR
jgi:transposase